jgi:predicted O-methyltransferase YrrM
MTAGANSAYANLSGLSPLVLSAIALAESLDFGHSCAPEQGRLLSVLARGWNGGRIGETGTGCGVGLAWMLEATDPSTTYVSIELDPTRASASARLYDAHSNVHVQQGDWRGLLDHGPFDLLVLDGGGKGKDPSDASPLDPEGGWLAIGGTIVLDDFVPAGTAGAAAHDAARQHWLNHPLLHATELRLSPTLATIVGTRVR